MALDKLAASKLTPLQTDRLFLRQWKAGDADLVADLWCSSEVMKYVRLEGPLEKCDVGPILEKQNARTLPIPNTRPFPNSKSCWRLPKLFSR